MPSPSANRLDDLDELVDAVSPLARESNKLTCLHDHRRSLGCACDVNAASAAELEDALISQLAERAKHGVRVDVKDCGEVAGRREAVARLHFTIGNRAADLRSDLLVQRRRLLAIDLAFHNGARHTSFITATVSSATGACRGIPADLLIAEARDRQWRRRRRSLMLLIAAAAAGGLTFYGLRPTEGTSGRAGPLPSRRLVAVKPPHLPTGTIRTFRPGFLKHGSPIYCSGYRITAVARVPTPGRTADADASRLSGDGVALHISTDRGGAVRAVCQSTESLNAP